MKKILISIFSLLLVIGVTNVNACETCGCKGNEQEIKTEQECPFTKNTEGEVICSKTGKVCGKDKKNCCKTDGDNEATKCSKGKKVKKCCKSKAKSKGFDYGKSNNYGEKAKSSTCNSTKKQALLEETTEEDTTEEK